MTARLSQIRHTAAAMAAASSRSAARRYASSSAASKPAQYVLTTVRDFPNLAPVRFQPVASELLGERVRRDILWAAVVHERDCERVGSKWIKGRDEMGYSNRKLRPQKGSGQARMDDRGNPTRHDGGRAHAYHPSERNYKTDLPRQVYSRAVRTALSAQYEAGRLLVVDGPAEFPTGHENAGREFLAGHDLGNRTVTFVVDEFRPNLHDATAFRAAKIDIVPKEHLTVQDILRPARLVVELDALKWLAVKHAPRGEIQPIRPSPVESVEEAVAEAQAAWSTPVWESGRFRVSSD